MNLGGYKHSVHNRPYSSTLIKTFDSVYEPFVTNWRMSYSIWMIFAYTSTLPPYREADSSFIRTSLVQI